MLTDKVYKYGGGGFQNARVLLVDDDGVLRSVLRILLEMACLIKLPPMTLFVAG